MSDIAEKPAYTKRRNLSLPVAELLAPSLKPVLARRGLAEMHLLSHWGDIVGATLARLCLPERVRFPQGERSGGTLYLRVASGWTLEVQHHTPVILERIAAYVGYAAVADIKLIQDPSLAQQPAAPAAAPSLPEARQSALAAQLQGVSQAPLQASLAALGRAVLLQEEARNKDVTGPQEAR